MKPIHIICLLCLSVLTFAACKKDSAKVPVADISVLPVQLPESLNSVFFTTKAQGYVGGAQGGIYKTINGGESWSTLISGVSSPVYGLWFVSSSNGFAVGGESSCGGTGCTPVGGFILRTTDGGQSWTKVYTPAAKVAIDGVFFTSASIGFCIGSTTIYKTTDGGST